MEIRNKNIVLTGASSGIGKEILKQLIQYEGTKVIAVARDVDSILAIEGKVYPFSSDLSTQYGVDNMFNYAKSVFPEIDMYISNAGFGYLEELETPDWKHIEYIYSVNVFSTIYALEKFSHHANGNKKLFVSTLSCAGLVVLPYYSLYCSTKAALHHFFRTYRYECKDNVRIMTVYPVATRTKFFDKASNVPQTPLPSPVQDAETVAKSVIRGIERNKREVYPSLLFRLAYPFGRAIPPLLKISAYMEKRKIRKWLNDEKIPR